MMTFPSDAGSLMVVGSVIAFYHPQHQREKKKKEREKELTSSTTRGGDTEGLSDVIDKDTDGIDTSAVGGEEGAGLFRVVGGVGLLVELFLLLDEIRQVRGSHHKLDVM